MTWKRRCQWPEQIAGEQTVRTRESALQSKRLERFHFSSHTGNAPSHRVSAPRMREADTGAPWEQGWLRDASARQQDMIHNLDHAVRLMHIGYRDVGNIALLILDRDVGGAVHHQDRK